MDPSGGVTENCTKKHCLKLFNCQKRHDLCLDAPPIILLKVPHPLPLTYTVHFDEDAGLASVVAIVTVLHPRALLQQGAVELAGAFGVVPHVSTVLLDVVAVGGAFVIGQRLVGIVVGWVGVGGSEER